MEIQPTALEECFVIIPTVFEDARGCFFESFNQQVFFEKTKIRIHFVQDNQSRSSYGVLRGLHLQTGKYTQAKLIRVLNGEILDVAVDIRKDSPTLGQHISMVLSEENKKQLFIPKGFAHGFVVLSKQAEVLYKCDNYYARDYEAGIIYNDPGLKIDWKVPDSDIILSEKDKKLPNFNTFEIDGNLFV